MDFLSGSGKNGKKDRPKNDNKKQPGDPPAKSKLTEYRDPISGLSLKKLKRGLWFLEKRPLFLKSLIGMLIAFNVAAWIYIVFGFGLYIIKGTKEDTKAIDELVARQIRDKRVASEQLQSSSVEVFSYGDKIDLAAKIENSNEHYRATFDYCFTRGEERIDCDRGFIFPKETKYIFSLSQDVSTASNIRFQIEDASWKRIDYHQVSDWKEFEERHLDFIFSDINYRSSSENDFSDKVDFSSLEFTARNNSPYDYWRADFNILLYNGPRLVGVNRYTVDEFRSDQERQIELVWEGDVGKVTDVEIKPDINITNEDNYMRP